MIWETGPYNRLNSEIRDIKDEMNGRGSKHKRSSYLS